MTSSSSRPRTRTTARMSVISVPDKDTIIKDLLTSLAEESEDNSELVDDLNALLRAKQDWEEHREHLQANVQRFAYYHDKAEKDHEITKELITSQAEVAELKAPRK